MFGFQGECSPSRRAADLLADRPDEPWSVQALASALGLGSRTLHRVVQRELGVSPMLLLRRVRLAQARADLEAPRPETSVTAVAFDCGLNHLGRFLQHYVRHFGEPASETLRVARRKQAGAATISKRHCEEDGPGTTLGRLTPAAAPAGDALAADDTLVHPLQPCRSRVGSDRTRRGKRRRA